MFRNLNFDNAQIAVLQSILRAACEKLGVAEDDEKTRRALAAKIIELAGDGEINPEGILAELVKNPLRAV